MMRKFAPMCDFESRVSARLFDRSNGYPHINVCGLARLRDRQMTVAVHLPVHRVVRNLGGKPTGQYALYSSRYKRRGYDRKTSLLRSFALGGLLSRRGIDLSCTVCSSTGDVLYSGVTTSYW